MHLCHAALILILLEEEEEPCTTWKHLCYSREFYFKTLDSYEKSIRINKIPRCGLLNVDSSAWRYLYHANNDPGFITFTGMNHSAFRKCLEVFAPYFDSYSPFYSNGKVSIKDSPQGRKRKIHPEDCLGLTLAWTRTRGGRFALHMIFGMTATNFAMYVKFGLRIIVKCLNKHKDAKIQIPNDVKLYDLASCVKAQYPDLDDVWCTMDGLKSPIQAAPDTEIQKMFYNSWQSGHYVTHVFVFAADGTIPICCFNLPGSTHDSTAADSGFIYDKLEKVY